MKNPAYAYAQALKGYRTMAAQGNAEAMRYLGMMYANGQGVPKNLLEAARWFDKAGARGDVVSLVRLGAFYANGQGVKKDMVQAYARFLLAKDLDHPGAGELLEKIAAGMTGQQVDEARTLAAEIKAKIVS